MKDEINLVGLYQQRANDVYNIIQLLKNHDRVISVKYTGFGKSYYIIPNLIQQLDSKFIIMVPNKSLEQQYVNRYKNQNVSILTYQIVGNISDKDILSKYDGVEYIICDECHHLGDNKWRGQVERLQNLLKCKIIGLTATPDRGDGLSVVKDFFNNTQTQSVELLEGIANNYVPKIKYVVAYADIDEKLNTKLKEIDRYKVNNLINVPKILFKYIDKSRLRKNIKILVYVSRLKYIKDTVKQCENWFNEIYPDKTINVYSISSLETVKQNEYVLNKFEDNTNSNSIDIMVSVNKIVEGLHLPTVSVEIMLRKTNSPVVYQQQIGRVVNSDKPIIFDFINNGSQLYQLQTEYKQNMEYMHRHFDKTKVMFEDCIELIAETKDIEEILNMYVPKYREIYYQEILENKRDYIESMSNKMSFRQLSDELSIPRGILQRKIKEMGIEFVSKVQKLSYEDTKKYILENIDYIKNSIGKVSVEEQLKTLNISRERYYKILRELNINFDKLWERIEYNDKTIKQFAKMYNAKNKKADIMKELDFDERLYRNYLNKCKELDLVRRKNTNKKLTEKQVTYILNSAKNKTAGEMARELNVERKTVYDCCKINGVECKKVDKRVPKVLTDELKKQIIEAYEQYGSFRQVGLQLDVGEKQVKNVIVEANIPLKHKKLKMIPLTEEEKLKIIDEYSNGLSREKIEKKYHRSRQVVNEILDTAGFSTMKNTKRLSNSEIENIQKDYKKNNLTLQSLMKRYRRDFRTIKNILKKKFK